MSEQAPNETAGPARPRPAWRNLLIAGLPLIVFLGLAAIFLRQLEDGGGSATIPSALIGKPVPQFELAPLEGLTDDSGKQVAGLSTDQLKGQLTVVNVWASWCAPCRIEHPVLMEMAKRDGVRLVGINYKDQTGNALRYLGQLGNPFAAIGIDPKGTAAIDWGVYGVPETFVVTADGIIAYKHVGPLTEESLNQTFLPELKKIAGAGAN